MKKRSLVAAIAMLIVSAIVLTSATYAWFASSASASVSSITASVSNNNGTVSVAPTGDNAKAAVKNIYKTTITANDYENLCQNFVPVSMNFTTTPQFNKVSYDTTTFSAFTAASQNGDYLTYQFKIKASNAADAQAAKAVTLTPTFTTNTGAFCYGIVAINDGTSTTYYQYNAAGSYEPLAAMSASITDNNGNAIIDSGDTGYTAGDMGTFGNGVTTGTSGSALSVMSVAANATAEATVTVWVWAEGQDSGCTGNVNAETAGFSFAIA